MEEKSRNISRSANWSSCEDAPSLLKLQISVALLGSERITRLWQPTPVGEGTKALRMGLRLKLPLYLTLYCCRHFDCSTFVTAIFVALRGALVEDVLLDRFQRI